MSLDPRDLPLALPKMRKRRKGRRFPPASRSARLYLSLPPSSVHIFRYLLEAEDNLGLMTVVDRRRAVILFRFSPHEERRALAFLESIRPLLPFTGPVRL